jgi:AbrB family looped-hinge helix DNA binding protein
MLYVIVYLTETTEMIMKVFAKGQVVIPAPIRKKLGISVGSNLDVNIDAKRGVIELTRAKTRESESLAGSLANYSARRSFPNRKSMAVAFKQGLGHGK